MNVFLHVTAWFCGALASVQVAVGQGTFQNLDFESASVPDIPSGQTAQVAVGLALPGWTVYSGQTAQSQILYNGVSLGGPIVTLIDRHTLNYSGDVIGGNFTVALASGMDLGSGNGVVESSGIAQAGTIPAGTMSLLFDASYNVSALQVSFGGNALPFFALAAGPNYTTYGADVSASAGLAGELRFTEQPYAFPDIYHIALLDDIRFSVQVIPEPGACGLALLGLLAFGGRAIMRCPCQRWVKRDPMHRDH